MRECPVASWIAVVVAGCLSGLLLYGQTPKRGVQDLTSAPTRSLKPGPYYALVIGNNNYRYLHKLETAVNDAKEVAEVLRERYGFETTVLLNADRNQIMMALVGYRRALPENSNLLIYYAGHGQHDRETDAAYWLPVDARKDDNVNWISSDDVTRDVRAIPSSHVLVISDSCYSGYLARDADVSIDPIGRDAYLAKMLKSKSRNLMSSGGDEPVADSGAPGHSVFAGALLKSLRQMDEDSFVAAELFQRFIQPGVAGRSDQLPQYSFIRNSGHDYGDFVFSRLPASEALAAAKLPHGLTSLSPGIAAWAVGMGGTILHTEDGGSSWTPQRSGIGADLKSVAFATPQSGWAVGRAGAILHTDDGGTTWTLQWIATGTLNSVAFTSPLSVWVVGDRGTILHTEDGGATWTEQSSGTVSSLSAVAFTTPQLGWAVGNDGTILHTENGGRSWKQQSSRSLKYIESLAFATPRFLWMADLFSGTILHTDDGGGTWTERHTNTGEMLTSISFVTPQLGWAVGVTGSSATSAQRNLILHSADGGSTWTQQGGNLSFPLDSVVFVTPRSGWAVGNDGTILHTVDGGENWSPQISGTHQDLLSIALSPPQSNPHNRR